MKSVFIFPIPIEIHFLIFEFEHQLKYKSVLSELLLCIDIFPVDKFINKSVIIHGKNKSEQNILVNNIVHIIRNKFCIYEVMIFNDLNIHEINNKLIEIIEQRVNSNNKRIILLDNIQRETFTHMLKKQNFHKLIYTNRHYNVSIIITTSNFYEIPILIRNNIYHVIQVNH